MFAAAPLFPAANFNHAQLHPQVNLMDTHAQSRVQVVAVVARDTGSLRPVGVARAALHPWVRPSASTVHQANAAGRVPRLTIFI